MLFEVHIQVFRGSKGIDRGIGSYAQGAEKTGLHEVDILLKSLSTLSMAMQRNGSLST
jgi:hypothetical protein